MNRFFRRSNDAGGSAAASGGSSAPSGGDPANSNAAAAAANGAGSGGVGGGAGGEGGSGGGKPDYDAQIKELTTKLDTLQKQYDKQGHEVGLFRNLKKNLAQNPQGVLAELAKTHGVDFQLGQTKNAMADSLAEKVASGQMTKEDANELLNSLKSDAKEGVLKEFKPVLSRLMAKELASKYADFDQHEDSRQDFQLQVAAGTMSLPELLHLAVRGASLEASVKEAEERGRQAGIKEVSEKLKKQLPDGNAMSQQQVAKQQQDVNAAVAFLNS